MKNGQAAAYVLTWPDGRGKDHAMRINWFWGQDYPASPGFLSKPDSQPLKEHEK